MQKLCPLNSPSRVGGDDGLQNEYIFSAVHEISSTFEMFDP